MSALSTIFAHANCLTASEPAPDLKGILFTRLSRYYSLKCANFPDELQPEQLSLEDLQRLTAKEALNSVLGIQGILEQNSSGACDGAALGARDLAQLRILLSIVFKWGTEPLLTSCLLNQSPEAATGRKTVDYGPISSQYESLVEFAVSLMGILFPNGSGGSLANTHISAILINRHLVDLLRVCFALGWIPKSWAVGSLRPVTLRLVSILSVAQVITALGGVLSSKPEPSPYMRRISTMLLGKQIIRPDGVNGLYAAVFGEEEMTGDDASLEKLEHISRVLTTVPPATHPQAYCQPIVYQILSSLSNNIPSTHKRAAAFTVSRMLATDSSQPHLDICARHLLSCLHDKFLQVQDAALGSEPESSRPFILTPSTAVSALGTLVANMDPHPASISRLLSPIVLQLYSLLHHLDKIKTSDPGFRESLHGLLITWGKIVEGSEGLDCLWSIYQTEEIYWKVDITGDIRRVQRPHETSSLSLFTPENLEEAEKAGSLDDDANIMDLYPDPRHFVRFLKAIDRTDITSNLFIKFLETYRDQRLAVNANPIRTLFTLQIVMQMQKQLSTGPSSSNLLCKPAHMLEFIKLVLESPEEPRSQPVEPRATKQPDIQFRVRKLTELDADTGYESGDSDDDVPGSEIVTPNDEMKETAINLLLSILEANDDLSARTMPILNDIYSLLEPMSHDAPSAIHSIAREGRMVMTARLASSSAPRRSRSGDEESSQEIYQKALKLLQDPILPVRAHGLLLLRQLVTRSKREVEPALIPAILSIFLQSAQDDESYLFLQSVQGLAAMVDSYGQDVLKALIREYTDGLFTAGVSSVSQHELDIRTRVGEALGIVIRRCGSTLGIYSDLLLPPLCALIRSRSVPTALRTSALSLLADCVSTYTLAILPYVVDLADAMIDLLQVEVVSARDPSKSDADTKPDKTPPTMDSQPLSADSKVSPLRRAAIHFLSLLIRSLTEQTYQKSLGDVHIYMDTLQRARTTLAYVASTDEDTIVRVMAREAGEGLEQLQQAFLGL